jgi:hypothetical protein
MPSQNWTRGPESRPVFYLLLVQSFFNIRLVMYGTHFSCQLVMVSREVFGPPLYKILNAQDHPNRKSMSEEKDCQSIS